MSLFRSEFVFAICSVFYLLVGMASVDASQQQPQGLDAGDQKEYELFRERFIK